MKRVLFIVNPRSGKGTIKYHILDILDIFSKKDMDLTVHITQARLDACKIAMEEGGRYDLVILSGGDGTLDEVVTGLMRSGQKRVLGYIPAGSTNDFANSLGIPKQMEQAARLITDGVPFSCDIGKFNDNYFVYVAAFGMLTDVSYQTRQDLKNALGHAAYVLEAMKRMGTWRSSHLYIECEEYTGEGDYVFGMVTNSDSVGGFKGLPGKNVALNDGMFEVMLVHTPKNLIEWQEAISAVLFPDQKSEVVQRFKTKHMVITSETPVAWTRDGENGGEHTRVELDNMCQVLEIMTPNDDEPVPHGAAL